MPKPSLKVRMAALLVLVATLIIGGYALWITMPPELGKKVISTRGWRVVYEEGVNDVTETYEVKGYIENVNLTLGEEHDWAIIFCDVYGEYVESDHVFCTFTRIGEKKDFRAWCSPENTKRVSHAEIKYVIHLKLP